jgi:hypothetical protein
VLLFFFKRERQKICHSNILDEKRKTVQKLAQKVTPTPKQLAKQDLARTLTPKKQKTQSPNQPQSLLVGQTSTHKIFHHLHHLKILLFLSNHKLHQK